MVGLTAKLVTAGRASGDTACPPVGLVASKSATNEHTHARKRNRNIMDLSLRDTATPLSIGLNLLILHPLSGSRLRAWDALVP